jgi:4-hydroxybenzoate polyprenyltransferase
MTESQAGPLCVNLEGTLLRTSLLTESLLALVASRPWMLLVLPLWLLRGKGYFQDAVAQRATLQVDLLPYREQGLAWLREQRAAGRRLVLVTPAHEKYAALVASHCGPFDAVFASNAARDLSQRSMRALLDGQYGAGGYELRTCIAGDARNGSLRPYVRALRPHQWLKNALIFLPLLAAHRASELVLFGHALLAFVAFCLAASAGYIVNDVLDLASDRRHVRKRNRPFASGAASVAAGIWLAFGLLAIALLLGLLLSPVFLLTLLLYLVGTVAYSTWLKRKAVVDVLSLAGLYTLRIVAGAAATGIAPSFWLLALSMFLFLDLACVKRYVELSATDLPHSDRVPGRGYVGVDRETVFVIGANSGLMSVLVLALYINSPSTVTLYPVPQVLWGLCPLALYWTSRIWVLARRGLVHDDPLVFATQDRISLLTMGVAASLMWLASTNSPLLIRLFS